MNTNKFFQNTLNIVMVFTLIIFVSFFVFQDKKQSDRLVSTPASTIVSPKPTEVAGATTRPVVNNEVIKLVNIERSKKGKKPLVELKSLNNGAFNRAKFIKTSGQWSHSGYEQSIKAVLKNKNAYVGENLGRYQTSAKEVVQDWVNSPTHLDVMTQDFTYAGVGHYEDHWVLWLSTRP